MSEKVIHISVKRDRKGGQVRLLLIVISAVNQKSNNEEEQEQEEVLTCRWHERASYRPLLDRDPYWHYFPK
jgi:hypothetical protein